jgi:hypothetical protein
LVLVLVHGPSNIITCIKFSLNKYKIKLIIQFYIYYKKQI